jgi:signal peptidase I
MLEDKYTDVSIEDGDWGPLKISAGQVLVMGDNQHMKASRDSRIFGAVSTKLIIGRVEVVLWPLNKIKGL